jgi:sulfur-oxidizing protein SoxA
MRSLARVVAFLLLAGSLCIAGSRLHAQPIPPVERRSGFEFMSPENQAIQRDDTLNPGFLWVLDGEALWGRADGAEGKSCRGCHGDAAESMRGVAARYPAFDAEEKRPVDLQERVNICRRRHQNAPVLPYESPELLALTAFLGKQSRGMPIDVPDDPRLAPARERGKALFERRIGQLNLSCSLCHDANWGKRLGGSIIPQGDPNGYPIYRLEWQSLGSLQRRLRNCMIGVRSEPFPYGAQELVDLELFLMSRARGLPIETPAVRP